LTLDINGREAKWECYSTRRSDAQNTKLKQRPSRTRHSNRFYFLLCFVEFIFPTGCIFFISLCCRSYYSKHISRIHSLRKTDLVKPLYYSYRAVLSYLFIKSSTTDT
jgi:hypothetical protein